MSDTPEELEVFGDYSVDSRHLKTYTSRASLARALHRMGVRRIDRPFAVRRSDGRWTAIFPVSACHGNLTAFPGFMKLG